MRNDRANLAGDAAQHAFVWRDGVMHDIGTLGGTSGGASYINGSGAVVGGSTLAGDVTTHAFLWHHGRMSDLGTLGGNYTVAYAQWINDEGLVAGGTCTVDWYPCHAVLWYKGTVTDLGTLPGAMLDYSWAQSVNNRGQVAGSAITATGEQHAVLWTPRDRDHR